MNTRAILAVLVPGALGVALAACADWDNPTARRLPSFPMTQGSLNVPNAKFT